MKMAISDVFTVHIFMIIETVNSKTTSERKQTTYLYMNMYRYVVTIAVHGESTISMFTKFFKIHFKKFGDEICIYMYICVTCNSDTRTLDQFCNKHVRFKQVIIHRILCVTLREQLHSRLSGDKKKKKTRCS